MPFTVRGPFERGELALAAPGQEQQPDEGDVHRPVLLVTLKRERKAAKLFAGQEPLAALAPVAPDADAGVAVFGTIAVDLGLAHDDGEDGGGAVRRSGGGVQGGEPALYVGAGDVGDVPSPEPGQYLIAEVGAIDLQRLRFPVPGVVPEDFPGHGLEEGLFGQGGGIAVTPNRGEKVSPHAGGPHRG